MNHYYSMEVSKEEFERLSNLYKKYYNDPDIALMKQIPMHSGSNCFMHVFKVAKTAFIKGLKCKKQVDLEAILVASIFHDFYLYNWRADRSKLKRHGHTHPDTAISNALKKYPLNELERQIIGQHMWPLNFSRYPKTKEAKFVSWADKVVAFNEMFHTKKYKDKRKEFYLEYYSTIDDLKDKYYEHNEKA